MAFGHEQTKLTGKEMIVLHNNSGGGNTLTVNSTLDPFGRLGDILNYTLDPGEHGMFGPFTLEGWRHVDGNLYFSVSSSLVGIAVIRLP